MARGRKREHKELRGSATFYIPKELHRKIKKTAKEKGKTTSDFVTELLTKEVGK